MINSPLIPIDHTSFIKQTTSLILRLSKWPAHFGTLASFHFKAKRFNLCLSGQIEELLILVPHWIYLYSNTMNQLFRTRKGANASPGARAVSPQSTSSGNLIELREASLLSSNQLFLPLQKPSNPKVFTSSVPQSFAKGVLFTGILINPGFYSAQ